MRNLKKILAMALAMVMTFSVMATASAFSDKDDINETYNEAVEVLAGLGVFGGDDRDGDGVNEFRAKDPITRAEVAAIIYRVATGDVDVNSTHKDIFAEYANFTDLAGYEEWAGGYIGYCANAEYIVGDQGLGGPFRPGANVTGYQVLAMILRAVGYDQNDEFRGVDWHVTTAKIAQEKGILKNVNTSVLSQDATRELVAELIFRAMNIPTVSWTMLGGYTDNDESLGEMQFDLHALDGVVTANEYADLYAAEPLAAGKTEINGTVYNVTTTLEDIGENHVGYAAGKDVLTIRKSGNTVYETGEEQNISNSSRFKNVTGLTTDDDETERYINFGGDGDVYESDYRLEYVLKFSNATARVAFEEDMGIELVADAEMDKLSGETYEKVIRPGNAITKDDMKLIKEIFSIADKELDGVGEYVTGEVYVGTKSTEDVSDEISYREFVATYINDITSYAAINYNENGNWLKVIDNDGDGVADYVLKTIYTFAQVEDISKSGAITLDTDEETFGHTADSVNELDGEDVVTEAELVEGDIVYYALIDGNAYTWLAEMVTVEIDKVNRNTLTATTTEDVPYIESGVHEHIDDEFFESGVKNLAGSTSYDLYLDKYGYLAVFTETATSGDFVLLTDGWFDYLRSGKEYYVKAYIDGEITEAEVTSSGALFIYDNDDDRGENNSWGLLKRFGNTAGTHEHLNGTGDDIWTTVASLNEDGKLIPVGNVYNKKTIEMIDMGTSIVDRNGETGNVYHSNTSGDAYTACEDRTDAHDNVEVRALSSTVYYYVYRSGSKTIVNEYVGYANVPSLTDDDKALIEDVYAVATKAERVTDPDADTYYNANVVVVEFADAYRTGAEVVFVYDSPEVGNNVKIEYLDVVKEDGTLASVRVDLSKSDVGVRRPYTPAYGKYVYPGLFYLWETSNEDIYTIERLTPEEIEDERFAVGTVRTNTYTGKEDWTELQTYYYNTGAAGLDVDNSVLEPLPTQLIERGGNDGNPEYRNVEGSVYYDLSYDNVRADSTGHYGDFDADIGEGTYDDVLDEYVRERGRDFYNTVLVSYNSSNQIVYAISFAHLDGDAKNFAQWVWESMIREYDAGDPTAAPTILDPDGIEITGWDWTGNKAEISIPYSDWKDWTNLNYTVKPAEGNKIAIDDLYTFNDKVQLVKYNNTDNEQTIVVSSQGEDDKTVVYTFEITYTVGGDTANLFHNKSALTPNVIDSTDPDNNSLYVTTWEKYLTELSTTVNGDNRDGATFTWTLYDEHDDVLATGNQSGSTATKDTTLAAGMYAIVVVTSQDESVTNTYWIDFPPTSAVAASYYEAALMMVEELKPETQAEVNHIAATVFGMPNGLTVTNSKRADIITGLADGKVDVDMIVAAGITAFNQGVAADVQRIAQGLKAATPAVSDADITDAVMDYLLLNADSTKLGIFNAQVTPEVNVGTNTVTLTVESGAGFGNTILGDCLAALIGEGVVIDYSIVYTYDGSNNPSIAPADVTNSTDENKAGALWATMMTQAFTGAGGEVKAGGFTGTITLNCTTGADVEYEFIIRK